MSNRAQAEHYARPQKRSVSRCRRCDGLWTSTRRFHVLRVEQQALADGPAVSSLRDHAEEKARAAGIAKRPVGRPRKTEVVPAAKRPAR